jgi:hypothetical protein
MRSPPVQRAAVLQLEPAWAFSAQRSDLTTTHLLPAVGRRRRLKKFDFVRAPDPRPATTEKERDVLQRQR